VYNAECLHQAIDQDVVDNANENIAKVAEMEKVGHAAEP
jgi:hypothetical protein